MNKKLIGIILSAFMLLSSFAAPSAFASEAGEELCMVKTVFRKSFDGLVTGAVPDETATNGNIIRVEEYPSSANKSVYFKSTNSTSGFTNSSVYTCDTLIFEFDIRYIDCTNASLNLTAYNFARNKTSFLVSIGDRGKIVSADGKVLAMIGESSDFTNIAVHIDIRTGINDVYVNGVKKASRINSAIASFTDIGEIRLNYGNGEGYMDNFWVYSAPMPVQAAKKKGMRVTTSTTLSENGAIASDEELAAYMGDSLALYSEKSGYYYKGEYKKYGSVIYTGDDASGRVSTAFAKDVFGIQADGDTMDAVEFALKIGKKLTLDKNGFAIFADRESYFTYTIDLPMYMALSKKLVFENIPASEMIELFYSRYEKNEHPRIFANKDGWDAIVESAKTDEHMKKAVDGIIAGAEKQLDAKTIAIKWDSQNTNLITARELKDYTNSLGMAYRLTGDERYAQKLWEHLEAVCNFPEGLDNWHFLSTGEYLYAIGAGYDWIYDYLDKDQRDLIVNTIVENGLKPAIEDYEDVPGRSRSSKWAQYTHISNWVTVCNTGVLVSAFAILEDEPEIAEKVIDYAMESIKKSCVGYAPDGAWSEGPTYWNFNTLYLQYFINSLDSMFGTDFGYMDAPGMKETVSFIIALHGENGTFNYGDAGSGSLITNLLLLFSDKLEMPAIQNYFLDNSNAAVDIFNYRPDFAKDAKMDIPLDYYARYVETVMMHSDYNRNSIFAAIHSGEVAAAHGQWDTGTINIDAYGTLFAMDFGQANYSHRPQNYLYRKRSEGHNTLTLNPDFYQGQNNAAFARISRFESSENDVFAITDLTDVYSRDAERAVRGLRLTDGRETIILQDEVTLMQPGEIDWFIHSQCPITVSEDGKSAIFEGKYKNMKATILSDIDAKFTVMQAKRLPTSPVPTADIDDSKVNKLALILENTKEATISVAFTFQWPGIDEPVNYTVVPLDDWKLQDAEVLSKPKLTDLRVNGKTLEDFRPSNQMYTVYYDAAGEIPAIEAEGSGTIEITYPESGSGNAYISITDENGLVSVYAIKLVAQNLKVLDNGSKQFFVYSLSASSVEQTENPPENVIDGDIETRYACTGTPYLTFDIGETKTITDAAVAVWQGGTNDGRKQTFEISVSNDGENFEHIFTGETTGTTLEPEYWSVPETECRYIRITFTLVNGRTGGWNSPTEVAFFGK